MFSKAIIFASVVFMATGTYSLEKTNTDIFALQKRLQNLGYYNTKITGAFGSVTQNAYKAFQVNNGFSGDGVVKSEEVKVLFSLDTVSRQKLTRNVDKIEGLSNQTFKFISPQNIDEFNVYIIRTNQDVVFKNDKVSDKDYLLGSFNTNLDKSQIRDLQRFAAIATINNVRYPVSFEIKDEKVNIHFLGSKGDFGIEDSEHQYIIKKLLGS